MGAKATEPLDITLDQMPTYLHANHSVYMDVGGSSYYLTDVNDRYWRVQDTSKLNEKGHYVDVSELVPTIGEFLMLPFGDDKETITSIFDKATFYASEKPE
ncbi:MAG: CDP-alcohol phosphatidyltransferase [Eggerthellaceae bacterium]|jgi:hypothetical protein